MNFAEEAAPTRYGVFYLADMSLALPLQALREVVPCSEVGRIPCGSAAVIGAIDLRGITLPVLDLLSLLGFPSDLARAESRVTRGVVVVAYQGRLLGLLADGVGGVLDCAVSAVSQIGTQDSSHGILSGGFKHADHDRIVSILSPAALFELPLVPSVVESGPNRQPDCEEGDDPDVAISVGVEELSEEDLSQLDCEAWLSQELLAKPIPVERRRNSGGGPESLGLHLVLARCGSLPIAVPSNVVFTTVLSVAVEASPLVGGYCVGTIEFSDQRVPAIDLSAFCGFGSRGNVLHSAFVARYPEGYLAFLVEEIIDVVRVPPNAAIALPRRALMRPELFAGAVPLTMLPEHPLRPAAEMLGSYLLLNALTLEQLPELCGLARLTVPNSAEKQLESNGSDVGAIPVTRMLTYDIGFEVATPIAQLVEILPWNENTAMLGGSYGSPSLVMTRGRAIPAFSLNALLGQPELERTETASVLVVEADGEQVGFTVSKLLNIDSARWAPSEKAACESAGGKFFERWEPIRVGEPGKERLISLLDLQKLAASI